MITGTTTVIAHLGYPTESFKAPMIYNPWFEAKGIDAVVVPLGVRPEDFAALFRPLFRITTLHGALVTMPHKVAVMRPGRRADDDGADRRRLQRGAEAAGRVRLLGDMFDGAGFVRGVQRKGSS